MLNARVVGSGTMVAGMVAGMTGLGVAGAVSMDQKPGAALDGMSTGALVATGAASAGAITLGSVLNHIRPGKQHLLGLGVIGGAGLLGTAVGGVAGYLKQRSA